MYIEHNQWPSRNGKIYESIYLRESYREGNKVKKRTIANLTHCQPEEIAAIELALQHKSDLTNLGSLSDIQVTQGPHIGATYVLSQIAGRLGLTEALGQDRPGQLALWQILARVMDQGSRLSAVRLAQNNGASEMLNFSSNFDEDDLYANLDWLAAHQDQIEDKLFQGRYPEGPPDLFLYDVTSSYLEGEHNELGDYGYNRDKKKGKKQIVIGLLCGPEGDPVSVEVFEGQTSDLNTFSHQVKKAAERFGCRKVTFVGDRGMIKSGQIDELSQAGFHYITAITKAQIKSLLTRDVLQMSLFDERLCEVEEGGVRYILRKNPVRAFDLAAGRASKLASIKALAETQNVYLAEHSRADQFIAWRKVFDKAEKLKIDAWLKVTAKDRHLDLEIDEEKLAELSLLDGCYVLKTDLPATEVSKEVIHERYKDLSEVESAFRAMKTEHLEVRPVFVRTEAHTRAHVLVVMLAYLIVRVLKKAWANLNITVEGGLNHLQGYCALEIKIKNSPAGLRFPKPDELTSHLLQALNLSTPSIPSRKKVHVDTHKKLTSRRKLN